MSSACGLLGVLWETFFTEMSAVDISCTGSDHSFLSVGGVHFLTVLWEDPMDPGEWVYRNLLNHLTIHSSLCRPSLFYSFLLPPFSSASHSNVNVWSGVTLGNLFTPMSVVPFSKAHIPQFLQQYMHQGVFVNVTGIFMKPFLSQSIKWTFSYMGSKVSVMIIHFWWSTHHVCNCCCFFANVHWNMFCAFMHDNIL